MFMRGREGIDLLESLAVEDVLRGAGRLERLIQEKKGLGVLRHILDVMGGTEEGEPSGPLEIADLGIETSSGRRIQPRSGLVQDQEARIAHQGPGNEYPLLLPPGKVLEAPGGQMSGPDLIQGFPYPVSIFLRGPADGTEIPVAAHENDILDRDGESPGKIDALGNVADGLAVFPRRKSKEGDRPRLGFEDPEKEPEDR
jgi:hypothetical protein